MIIDGIKSRYYTYIIDETIFDKISERFIAFDTETTGLYDCRIIELGAVLFEYGVPVKRFDTLVNIGQDVPPEATAVNHITTLMLKKAPSPKKAYADFLKFIGDAANGETFIVCHNTDFDMMNLIMELSSSEYVFKCLDTLRLSRALVSGMSHYKLSDLADYFGIKNENAHRACSDAEVCGKILVELMQSMSSPNEIIERKKEKNRPTMMELPYCKHIYRMLKETGYDMSDFRFVRKRGLYVAESVYTILEFKITTRSSYAVVERREVDKGLNLKPCNKTEGEVNGRLVLASPSDLDLIKGYIIKKFKKAVDWTNNVYNQMYPENLEFIKWERSLYESFELYME